MSFSQEVRQRRRGGSRSFLAVSPSSGFLLAERKRGGKRERESCNCCQSLLSTTLKAAAVSQLSSERSLGCVASPQGLWRIWWVLSPPVVYLSLSTAVHCFWVQGNQKAKSLSHSETERWIIEKIILSMPAMIWMISSGESFPPKYCTQISQNKRLSWKHQGSDFDMSVFSPDNLSTSLADIYSSKLHYFYIKQLLGWQTVSFYVHLEHDPYTTFQPAPQSHWLQSTKKSLQRWRLTINTCFCWQNLIRKNIFTQVMQFSITSFLHSCICICLWLLITKDWHSLLQVVADSPSLLANIRIHFKCCPQRSNSLLGWKAAGNCLH